MVIRPKKQKQCQYQELTEGDSWVASPYASSSGLILSARVSKHTDQFIEELLLNTEGKTSCKKWLTDDWGEYERVLPCNRINHW
ncbi:MAG: hypothetical protein O4751_02250 [Trichodesmium sp. St2_bin6]|nr:hypothetical protein [Trichodesmium sp. St5_bin8]MDE5077138.1 hypothetical protein [Trichodesmium sp. St2_bin6]